MSELTQRPTTGCARIGQPEKDNALRARAQSDVDCVSQRAAINLTHDHFIAWTDLRVCNRGRSCWAQNGRAELAAIRHLKTPIETQLVPIPVADLSAQFLVLIIQA